MKKQHMILIVVLLTQFSISAFAQAPLIQWQRSMGGTLAEFARHVMQTTDGGYITIGYSESTDGDVTGNLGSYDFWVTRQDSLGNLLWQKCLGGSATEAAYSNEQTSDGGNLIAGDTRSNDSDVTGNHGGRDFWIVQIDTAGNIQWQKCLGGSQDDYGTAAKQTSDGGYILGGFSYSNDGDVTGHHGPSTRSDMWIAKLDSARNITWQKSLGGSESEYANSIIMTNDGGYIAAGQTNSSDGDVTGFHGGTGTDYWVVKLDSMGNIQWQKCYGGTASDIASDIKQTNDGGYVVAGQSRSNNGDVTGLHFWEDYWVVKIDSLGNIQWQKCLGGSFYDYAYSIQQTVDGGYVVAGNTDSNDGDVTGNHGTSDCWIVKLDSTGNIQWQKCYGGTSTDAAYCVQQTGDLGYVIAGSSGSSDGDATLNQGFGDYWIVKLYPDFPSLTPGTELFSDLIIFPNPATNQLAVRSMKEAIEKIDIYNVLGERIFNKQLSTSSLELQTIDVSQLTTGIYFVKVFIGEKSFCKKLFVEHE